VSIAQCATSHVINAILETSLSRQWTAPVLITKHTRTNRKHNQTEKRLTIRETA